MTRYFTVPLAWNRAIDTCSFPSPKPLTSTPSTHILHLLITPLHSKQSKTPTPSHSTLPASTTHQYAMSPLSVPKIFMAGGAVGFGYYLYMRQYWFPNPYKTQGIENIENRFSSGGGNPTHAPAQASQRGTAQEAPQ